MTAGIYELKLEQGATFRRAIRYIVDDTPVDLTGYDIRMQIRPQYADRTEDILLEANLDNGRIEILDQSDPDEVGYFVVTISAEDTESLQWDRQAFYDIELESSSGNVVRLLAGRATLFREVTR